MSRGRVQIMKQFDRKSHEYKAVKRYWKLIQQDSRKLSDKRFYRPTFRMHLTNKEILDKLLSYSEDLKLHYNLYQLLLFHFQNKEPEKMDRDLVMTSLQSFHDKRHPIKVFEHPIGCLFMILKTFCLASSLIDNLIKKCIYYKSQYSFLLDASNHLIKSRM